MNEPQEYIIHIVLGIILIAIPVVKAMLEKSGIPALVGYVSPGLLTKIIDYYFPFITSNLQYIIAFLAHLGIVVLLFHVGLKSNIKGLIKHKHLIW